MMKSSVIFVAAPDADQNEVRRAAEQLGVSEPLLFTRRGISLGWIGASKKPEISGTVEARQRWLAGDAVLLPQFAAEEVGRNKNDIEQSLRLVNAVLAEEEIEELLRQEPYASSLSPRFELLSSTYDEGDPQGIVKLDFDALEDGEIVGEGLWIKSSWLSFYEEDASLRFRFSFGVEGYEDVAADFPLQTHAADLTEAVFPESRVISANRRLETYLKEMLAVNGLAYVERIVYFNAPNGGAQFHHDAERGHLGVVFAQLYGCTGWLALSKDALMDEIQAFLARPESEALLAAVLPEAADRKLLRAKAADRIRLAAWLDERDNEPLEFLLNRVPAFFRQLVDHGYAYIVNPGDIILLPQQSINHCCWHTVFCLDDFPGHALSFAVRERPLEE